MFLNPRRVDRRTRLLTHSASKKPHSVFQSPGSPASSSQRGSGTSVSVVVPTLIRWQIQVRRNSLFINALNREHCACSMHSLPIEAAPFYLRESIGSRSMLDNALPRMMRAESAVVDYSLAIA
jgi:hypothetical protein